MADAAAARREARRRRILENSQNRLHFISGKNSTDSVKGTYFYFRLSMCKQLLFKTLDALFSESPSKSPIPDFPDQNIESPVPSECSSSLFPPITNNGMVMSEPNSSELLLQSQDFVAAGDRQIMNDLAGFISPPPELDKKTKFEQIVTYKYDIVILSLLIQLLYSLHLFTVDNGYFFLPVIIYVITKLIWFPVQSQSKIANVLMLLNGMSAQTVQKMLSVSQCVGVITQDVCVYLFTTICVQSILKILKDSFGT